MSIRLPHAFAAYVLTILAAMPAAAQSVGEQLSGLLTEQAPAPSGFVRDAAAAAATRDTIAGLLLVELTNVPLATSSGGFVYRLNTGLGTIERASESFGPFFTERTLRSGARQLALGFSYQASSFGALQGADLTAGTFPTNSSRLVGTIDPFSVDTLNLDIEVRSATGWAHYGITDDLDIGVQVPFVRLRFSGLRQNTLSGRPSFNISRSDSASGLGDVSVNGRYRLKQGGVFGLAVGADLRLPTGSSEDLLGAGDAGLRSLVVSSWEDGQVAAHLNGGFGVGGASNEVFWGGALTLAPVPRVTLVTEVIGRYFTQLNRVAQVYQPHPVLAGVETMRWLPEKGGASNTYSVAGVKWNPSGALVINASVLFQLADAGLRQGVTPTISLDYAFNGSSRSGTGRK